MCKLCILCILCILFKKHIQNNSLQDTHLCILCVSYLVAERHGVFVWLVVATPYNIKNNIYLYLSIIYIYLGLITTEFGR